MAAAKILPESAASKLSQWDNFDAVVLRLISDSAKAWGSLLAPLRRFSQREGRLPGLISPAAKHFGSLPHVLCVKKMGVGSLPHDFSPGANPRGSAASILSQRDNFDAVNRQAHWSALILGARR